MKMKKKIELLEQLKTITDFRKDTHKIEYPLHEVLFMTLFGLLKGYVTFKDLHCWMSYNEENELFKKLFKKEQESHKSVLNVLDKDSKIVVGHNFEGMSPKTFLLLFFIPFVLFYHQLIGLSFDTY